MHRRAFVANLGLLAALPVFGRQGLAAEPNFDPQSAFKFQQMYGPFEDRPIRPNYQYVDPETVWPTYRDGRLVEVRVEAKEP